MNSSQSSGLLPSGMSDLLAPDAAFEASLIERLITVCEQRGYDRVKPPMMEFEDSLLSGTGSAMDRQVFRLMDPISQRMMGLRADMTPQIARIAESRLHGAPRPLRLCYAGQVLRTRGDQIRPERQFAQVGAELIGSENATADAEILLLAHDALANVGVTNISIDLSLPKLVSKVIGSPALETLPDLRAALDQKDVTALTKFTDDLGSDCVSSLKQLISASGPAEQTLAVVKSMGLTALAQEEWDRLTAVVACVHQLAPDLTLTIDPVEHRGFEYHAGVTFTIYATGVRGELGSGGRYLAGATGNGVSKEDSAESSGEPATGFTLFTDSLLRALPRPSTMRRVYVPHGTNSESLTKLRADGWVTIVGLEPAVDASAEANRLACTHYLDDGTPVQINDET